MKKIYFIAAAVGLATSATAQQGVTQAKEALRTLGKSEVAPQATSPVHQLKAPGDPIWSEDFNGDPGWTTGGAQDIWAFDTDGPNGQYSDPAQEIIQSTTAGNGFMIYDADANQTPTPGSGFFDHVGWLETPVIDMSGYTELTLTFEHTYRTCCTAGWAPTVQVSDDGFATFETYEVGVPGVTVNSAAPTTYQKVNLSGFIATATDLTNVQIRFLFDGTGGTSHYWWQLDDVAVIESFTNDLRLDSYFLSSGSQLIPYHYVPTDQIVDVQLSGFISNIGANTQNGVEFDVLTDDGTNQANYTSAPFVLNSGASDSVATSTNWLPSGTAGTTFDLTFSANQTESEQEPMDNQMADVFNITDSVYSVDNGTIQSTFSNFASNSGQPIGIGNQMEIMNDTYITSMSVRVTSNPDANGQAVYGQLHILDQGAGAFVYQDETNFYTLTNSDLGGFVTLVFTDPIQVSAGDIILPMAFHDGQDVAFGTAQRVEQGIVVGYTPSDQSYGSLIDPNAIMVRVNLNPSAGINTLAGSSIDLKQFPNPFSNETNVEFTLENSSEVSYTVVDVTGKVLVEGNEGVKSAGTHTFKIDGSSFSNGIYYLNMKVDGSVVTRKLVVNK